MERKKSLKADLENKKGLFLEVGLVIALVACLVAFNVKSYDMEDVDLSIREATTEIEEQIIQTVEQDTPPPPEPEAPEVVTEVTVVENDADIKNELGIVDMSENKAENVEVQHVEVKEEEVVEEEIFTVVEKQAAYPGGAGEMLKFLRENIQYPTVARENNIQGKVYVQFVVERDGTVSQVKVIRDIGGGCGAEAVRVVKSMPKWEPAKQQGRTVRSYFTLPVNFALRG